jgi:hypothetical protein
VIHDRTGIRIELCKEHHEIARIDAAPEAAELRSHVFYLCLHYSIVSNIIGALGSIMAL